MPLWTICTPTIARISVVCRSRRTEQPGDPAAWDFDGDASQRVRAPHDVEALDDDGCLDGATIRRRGD